MRLTCDLRNHFTQLTGTLVAPDVPDDKIRKAGEILAEKISAAQADFNSKGKDEIRLFTDMLNLKFLGDEEQYPESYNEITSMIAGLEPSCKAMTDMGFDYDPHDFTNHQLLAKKIARTGHYVITRLWMNFVNAVTEDRMEDTLVDDILFDSLADLCKEVLTPYKYGKLNNIEGPEDFKSYEEVILDNYPEAYNEWVNEACEDIMFRLLENPLSTALICPEEFSDTKVKVTELLDSIPVNHDRNDIINIMEDTDPNNIYTGEFFEKVLSYVKALLADNKATLTQEEFEKTQTIIKDVAKTIDTYMESNKISQNVTFGGQQFRPLKSVNLCELLLHTLISASYKIRTLYNDNLENKQADVEYIVDLIREYLSEGDMCPISDETPYRLLSLYSLFMSIDISKQIFLRVQDSTFISANQVIGEYLQSYMSKNIIKESEQLDEEHK